MSRNVFVFGLAFAVVMGSMSVFTVGESQKAIKFRLGKIVETNFEPGLHFQIPFINNVKKFDARILTLDSAPALFMTSEKKNVTVDYFVKWKIKDVEKFYTSVSGDVAQANIRLDQIIQPALRIEFSSRTIKDVVSTDRAKIRDNVIKAANRLVNERDCDAKDGGEKGCDVKDVEGKVGDVKDGEGRVGDAKEGEGKIGDVKDGEGRVGDTKEGEGKIGDAKDGQGGADNARDGEGRADNARDGEGRGSNARDGEGRGSNARDSEGRGSNARDSEGRGSNARDSEGRGSNARDGEGRGSNARDGEGRVGNASDGEGRVGDTKEGEGKVAGARDGDGKGGGNSKGLGIEIVDIRIIRIDLPKEVSASVYRRMESERAGVAWTFRARGAEMAERKRADADREREVILGNAYREAEIKRGEGDATAAEIYAQAYGKDKDFFAFYRSLSAYRQAFKNEGDSIVLEPNSEFFQYFKKSTK